MSKKHFLQTCIWAGRLSCGGLCVLVYYADLPWWKWVAVIVFLLGVSFGCYAERDERLIQSESENGI